MRTGWQGIRHALRRERVLPALRLPGTTALLGLWIGAGAPAISPSAGVQVRSVRGERYPLQFAAPSPTDRGAQSTFAAAVEVARLAWSRHDAAGIVRTSRELVLQLPDAETRASVGRDQAARLVAGVLRRTEGVAVRVQTAREVRPGHGYAELVRQYRVSGTDEVRSQRILLAFREAPAGGGWELVELRVLQAGE